MRWGWGDVLILGSFPGPFFALFCNCAVDEKLAVPVFCGATHVVLFCQVGDTRGIEAAALYGRKTGRKAERFIVEVFAVRAENAQLASRFAIEWWGGGVVVACEDVDVGGVGEIRDARDGGTLVRQDVAGVVCGGRVPRPW